MGWIPNNMFEKKKIILPVNLGNCHWATVVVFTEEKIIKYYDSMGNSGGDITQSMLRFVTDGWNYIEQSVLPDIEKWKCEDTKKIPQQNNGYDCGVFCCMFAKFIAADKQYYFHKKMLLLIIVI